jgi:hypothetical protein
LLCPLQGWILKLEQQMNIFAVNAKYLKPISKGSRKLAGIIAKSSTAGRSLSCC